MPNSAQVGFEDSIANALGLLYERKARGTTLIRVLEDYRRVQAAQKSWHHGTRATSCGAPKRELERLRLRRAALEQLIRSMEAYSRPSLQLTSF
jgi:hypothetical protein